MIDQLNEGYYWAWFKSSSDRAVVYIQNGSIDCSREIDKDDIDPVSLQAVPRPIKFDLSEQQISRILEMQREHVRLKELTERDGRLSPREIGKASGVATRTIQAVYWQPHVMRGSEWRKIADPLIEERKNMRRQMGQVTNYAIADELKISKSLVGRVIHQYGHKFDCLLKGKDRPRDA